jgi:hypothetical protein
MQCNSWSFALASRLHAHGRAGFTRYRKEAPLSHLDLRRTFARVLLTPPWPLAVPPILPMMWVDLWKEEQRVGWFGGAVGGVTFGGLGQSELEWR